MKCIVWFPDPVIIHQRLLSRNFSVTSNLLDRNSIQAGHYNTADLPEGL